MEHALEEMSRPITKHDVSMLVARVQRNEGERRFHSTSLITTTTTITMIMKYLYSDEYDGLKLRHARRTMSDLVVQSTDRIGDEC